jgi:hypothetical protein
MTPGQETDGMIQNYLEHHFESNHNVNFKTKGGSIGPEIVSAFSVLYLYPRILVDGFLFLFRTSSKLTFQAVQTVKTLNYLFLCPANTED